MAASLARPEPLQTLAFDEHQRSYSCTVAPLGSTARGSTADKALWWWFTVSDARGARYAPFLASVEDTPESVRARVIAYYEGHLERRAAPNYPRWRRAES